MDYNRIWNGLNTPLNTEGINIEVTSDYLSIPIDNPLPLPTVQLPTLPEYVQLIMDYLDDIYADIESENHVFEYADYEDITSNIREIRNIIVDEIRPIMDKYTENGQHD